MRPLVTCVWVQGNVPYTADYVRTLQSMVERKLPDHGFVCLTDRPRSVASTKITAIEVPTPVGIFGWWAKVYLFSADKMGAYTGRRCLYLDLDSGLVGSMEAVLNYDSDFALVPDDAPNFLGKGKRVTVKKFNSSVMVWNIGQQDELFSRFIGDPQRVTDNLWGDQDWIGQLRGSTAQAMPLAWFPRLSQCRDIGPSDEAKVVLCKKPKPHIAAQECAWFKEVWQ